MNLPRLEINATPSSAEIEFLENRIYEYNVEATGITDGKLLSIFIRDKDGTILAGLYGWTWGGTGEIRDLWVQREQRGLGWGKALLAAAEQEAIQRGCTQIVLDTHSFQAPAFYQKFGYTIIGEHPDYPNGHTAYYMRKKLSG